MIYNIHILHIQHLLVHMLHYLQYAGVWYEIAITNNPYQLIRQCVRNEYTFGECPTAVELVFFFVMLYLCTLNLLLVYSSKKESRS